MNTESKRLREWSSSRANLPHGTILYRLSSYNGFLWVNNYNVDYVTLKNRIIAGETFNLHRHMPECCFQGMKAGRLYQFNQTCKDTTGFVLITTGDRLSRSIEFFKRKYLKRCGSPIEDVLYER